MRSPSQVPQSNKYTFTNYLYDMKARHVPVMEKSLILVTRAQGSL